jgi:signal transduction histidine kinase
LSASISQRSRPWLVGCGALLVLAVGWAFIVHDMFDAHDRVVAAALERSAARSEVFRDFVDATVSSAALAMRQLDVRTDIPGIVLPSDRELLAATLRRTVRLLPGLSSLAVLDRNGDIVLGAPTAAVENLADRPFFQWHIDNPSTDLLVSPPDKPGGPVPISLRAEDEAGRFAGIVLGLLKPDYFASFMRSLGVDTACIQAAGGMIVLREPGGTAAVAREGGGPALAETLRLRAERGDRAAPGGGSHVATGEGMVGTARSAASYAVLTAMTGGVFVAMDLQRVLGPWRKEAWHRVLGGTIYTALVGVLVWLMIRTMRRDQTAALVLRKAQIEADTARRQAEEADRNKSLFLAHTSHELRTPLNAIIGFSEVLAKEVFGPLEERYREYSRDIHHSGQHLLAVVDNILDLAKVSAGRWQITRDRFTLDEVLDDVGRLAAPDAAMRDVELKRDIPEDLPDLYTDRRVLRQVLLNLVGNGIKFTEAGGVVAVVASVARSGRLIILVLDTGVGIEPMDLKQILEPFSNVSDLVARKQGGTGLGLPLCRAFVQLLGGELTITSELGEGTSIRVALPPDCLASGTNGDDVDVTAA